MKSISRLITLVFIFLANNSFAQKVTKISAEQVGQTIQVSYYLETESPCTVSLFYSTDNGSNWQGPLKKVSGDVGEKISSGNKKITWDVLSELEQLKFSGVVFKIDARKPGLKEVKIGSQIWSSENLNIDRYSNGDIIPQVTDATEWSSLKTGAWCYYNNDSSNGPVYGKLYNWYAVADSRGLCPLGWRVPSDLEWNKLEETLGGATIVGGKLKEMGLTHWAFPNEGAVDLYGFRALPAGYRLYYGKFDYLGRSCDWWTRTDLGTTYASGKNISYLHKSETIGGGLKSNGFSIRCIKD